MCGPSAGRKTWFRVNSNSDSKKFRHPVGASLRDVRNNGGKISSIRIAATNTMSI